MMAEIEGLVKKITSDLRSVLAKDLQIDDFDIIPTPEAQNKSPIVYIDHKLGIESWCVQHVFCYAYKTVISAKNVWKRKDIDELAGLCDIVVLLNPDILTIWNLRKDLVKNGGLSLPWELHINKLTLTRKPKSPDAFCHRRWVLSCLSPTHPELSEVIQNEFSICTLTAERYANNYYSWSHRRWVLQKLVPSLSSSGHTALYLSELEFSRNWVSCHVSDYSGIQYLQTIMDWFCFPPKSSHIPEELSNPNQLLQTQLMDNMALIKQYSGHEALWCHRRYLLTRLQTQSHVKDEMTPAKDNCEHALKRTRLEDVHVDQLFSRESDYIEEILMKETSSLQISLALKHKHWVKRTRS